MSGGSRQTTQTVNNAPWAGSQPALQNSINAAQSLFNSGIGAQVYGGRTTVDPSATTMTAARASEALGNANIGGRGLSGQYQSIIDAGGYNPAQAASLKNTQNLANSSWAVSPELQRIIDQTNADANTNVSLANSASGRYGSGQANSAVADAISKNTNNLLYSDLNNFNARKDAANTSLFNMGQNAIGNIGTAYTGQQSPITDIAKTGQFYDDYATGLLNDQLRIFNEQQNKPWENLSRLNAIASGAGQLGSTQTTSQPGQNPFLTALGYGVSGLGLLGGL